MQKNDTNHFPFLAGPGEMADLIRAKDWSQTSIGNPVTWPPSLRISVGIMLHNKFPMCLFWGPDLVHLYNDAYRLFLGENGKHPTILGMKGKEAWSEAWHIVKPLTDHVLKTGEGLWSEDQPIGIYRNGKVEEGYWTFSYSPVFDDLGGPAGVFVTVQETTGQINNLKHLKESEERFRKMAETIPEIAWVASPDNAYRYFNKGFYDYTGLSVEEAADDWQWETIVHPDMFMERKEKWEHSLKTGDDFYFEALFKRYSDHSYRWHISRATAIHNEEGEITLWVGTSFDIHEQKLFSQELERQVKEKTKALIDSVIRLQHSNENLEQFASIASHDLQEPLRKIQTFTALLQQRHQNNIPGEANILINKIKSSSERMSILIRDVLNFSKITNTLNPFISTDLNDILNNVLNDFELYITEKKVILNKQQLPKIEAIPVQINQLFYNLLSNAFKFSKNNVTPVITITSRKLLPDELKDYKDLKPLQLYYLIIFKDNGIGFDEQFAEDIFLIFHRLNDSNANSGTGIGLALCKKIVTNHHGRICAIGKEGEGASFCIILPVKQSYFL